MKYYRFPENRITRIGFLAFFFLILFFTRSAMPATHLIGVNTCQFIQLGFICLLGFAFLFIHRKSVRSILMDKRITVVVTFSVIMLLPMFFKKDWQLMYFSILLGLLFAVFLTFFLSLKDAAKYYVYIMAFFAVFSLIALFLLKPLANSGILPIQKLNYVNWYEYYYFGFAFTVEPASYYRLYGIFREPGLYQFFLIIALYFNNYTLEWESKKAKWILNGIFGIATALTFSTNGVLELVLFAVVIFFDKKYYKDRKIRIATLIGLIVLTLVLLYAMYSSEELYKTIKGMVVKIFSGSRSASARYESIYANLVLFLQSPVFGEKISTVLYAVEDNTCSTLILYAIYGIVGGTLNVIAWFSLVWEKNRKFWVNTAYSIIIFMSFNTQNLTWDIMFWLFPMMALTEKVVPWLECKFPGKTTDT